MLLDTGTVTRSVDCMNSDGHIIPDESCVNVKPDVVQECDLGPCPCETSVDCAAVGSSGNFICAAGVCECADGWAGVDCDSVVIPVPPSCESGIVDVNGTCCAAYIDSLTGECWCRASMIHSVSGEHASVVTRL
jgi:hypothetical protein